MNAEAKGIFTECFECDDAEAEIIIGFAENHGEIFIKRINGDGVNMVCTAPICDTNLNALYVFACATKKQWRGRGLFKAALQETLAGRQAILIPESEDLFPMYEKMGFSPLYCIEAEINGACTATDFTSGMDTLYEIYSGSNIFPKKSKALFEASTQAFLHYGGKILQHGDTVIFNNGNTATEIFAPDRESAIFAALHAINGQGFALLPLGCEAVLNRQGIKHRVKKIAMCKGIDDDTKKSIFINNLFN